MIAPLRMCAPGSEPFSSTTTDTSLPCSAASCLQPDRGGQAGRAAADDDDVVFHRFARAVLLEQCSAGVMLFLGFEVATAGDCNDRGLEKHGRAAESRLARHCGFVLSGTCDPRIAWNNRSHHELRDRSVGPRRAGHRRLERAGHAVREDTGALGRRGRAGRPAHRAAEVAARRDRSRRRRCACGRRSTSPTTPASRPRSPTPRPRWARSTSWSTTRASARRRS